jgi:predicted MFS family arabinose efflux permease
MAEQFGTARGTIDAAYAILGRGLPRQPRAGRHYGQRNSTVMPSRAPVSRLRVPSPALRQVVHKPRPFQMCSRASSGRAWSRGMRAVFHPRTWPTPDPAGHAPLREAIAGYLATSRGVRCTAQQILITISAIQMLVPMAAGLVGEAHRGRIIGNVMNGPMIGILLSRPIASLAAAAIGWRGAYALDAVAVAAIAVALNRVVPRQQPVAWVTYAALITSLWMLLVGQPVVRRRTLYQALCMGAFGIFWMAIGLRLSATPFELDRVGIALFALTGIGGAVIAPVAGWAGDRGWTTPATRLAHAAVISSPQRQVLAGSASIRRRGPGWPLGLLAAAAIVLDLGVIGDQTLGRRAVNLTCPPARGRLNGLYTGLFFIGGAGGAALAGTAWVEGGRTLVCLIGLGFGVAALAFASILPSAADKAPIGRN